MKNTYTMHTTYTSPELEYFEIYLELFTGSVLGGDVGVDDWENEDLPDATL